MDVEQVQARPDRRKADLGWTGWCAWISDIDGPNLAIWTQDGGWVVENEGVAPDVEVEQSPADVIAGRDPQLEKAVELVMAELKRNPPVKAVHPAYPNKTIKK